ncbi:class I SAM-dependent methyltransferase [Streptomyces rubradiris]|uniref:Methyltransferase n=1 Tax=Streptomyces rubradiris TaxID=285531 RepID=A0ABQ3RBY1_STRRR|nr:class I SAM-dependent methyltransferase [Streptomyces rubradiris]GHG92441.1 methyltransferase [Streptomyces rubradiris]GHI53327.1 methyltransferase [Streptomyces rubradiris]
MTEENGRTPAAVVFDALGLDYERAYADSTARRASLDWLLERLAPGSRVLDVGSGTGRPTAHALAGAGHRVLGIDVSPVMVELAARQVPGAEFRLADIRDAPLAEASFDAVCAYFSLLQLSRAEQAAVVAKLARVVRPGGLVALATVPLDVEDAEGEFMGRSIRVTSFGAEAFTGLVAGAGLTVLAEECSQFTPDLPGATPEPQLFVHARRPDQPPESR